MQSITLLGSTGSIGTQSLDVVRRHRDRFDVVGLSTWSRLELLAEQIREFDPLLVVVPDQQRRSELLAMLGCYPPEVVVGEEGLIQLASLPEADTTLVATVGSAGLRPTMAALRLGRRIALANKEVLVMAGELMMREARQHGSEVLPIDSEHSALLQCLTGHTPEDVRRLLVTASGGPFRQYSLEQMKSITLKDALAHPTWSMGAKITIDSATLMNKGLEVLEAHHLFAIDFDRIEVVLHPQSIIHSLVEFVDGSQIAQLGLPDMRVPIQYALSYPQRMQGGSEYLDLASVGTLTFSKPDFERFPCLALAYQVGRAGGSRPAVFSVANEVANAAFREERIGFLQVAEIIDQALQQHNPIDDPSLDEILDTEEETRHKTRELLSLL
jgi:1-deoxy-D-xylulose-5-phosphate reductoisomerase